VAVIVDSSVWIDYLEGNRIEAVVRATADMTQVLSPLVIAELLSGELTISQREFIGERTLCSIPRRSSIG
jgi:predicted nucleic acid-binding protein